MEGSEEAPLFVGGVITSPHGNHTKTASDWWIVHELCFVLFFAARVCVCVCVCHDWFVWGFFFLMWERNHYGRDDEWRKIWFVAGDVMWRFERLNRTFRCDFDTLTDINLISTWTLCDAPSSCRLIKVPSGASFPCMERGGQRPWNVSSITPWEKMFIKGLKRSVKLFLMGIFYLFFLANNGGAS